jgi:hypothetical protein
VGLLDPPPILPDPILQDGRLGIMRPYTSSGDKLKVVVLLSRVERHEILGEIVNCFPAKSTMN